MKNLIRIVAVIILIFLSGNHVDSQVNPHAIGIRGLQSNYGSGGEITYQHGMGDANRLEVDLGWRGSRANGNNYAYSQLSVVYQWVWSIADGFNWYAGLGGQLGSYRDKFCNNCDGFRLSAGGQFGIEYDFNNLGAPILLSIDTRPMLAFNNYYIRYGAAFSIRYTF